ncbi:(d)CMP kinase [Crocinitomix algicola]|uniref:(d)CMP kinase n=1 Tax=Crocinitomix algicola TaxID=1740263 RepID=UPI000831F60B|nr:(d)CMP kinase [Crocinitomix algicola]
MSKLTIAIDGFSSCGKSTLAKEIAQALNYIYADSGAMYRAVTLYMLDKGILKDGAFIPEQVISALDKIDIAFKFDASLGKSETYLNGVNVEKDIRNSRISKNVSGISAVKEVREKLVEIQQNMGKTGGVVMDGRDIGTVVFPNAEVKLFMTASNRVRAERRYKELKEKGENISLDQVAEDLQKRDYIDMNREISPLRKADDAIEIDNSELTRASQLETALAIIKKQKSKLLSKA